MAKITSEVPVSGALEIPEACDRLKIDRSTLYRWIRKGKIKVVQVGERVLVPLSEIDRIVQEVAGSH